MADDLTITGGADPEVAAAIAAVVDQVIRQEAARDTGDTPSVGRSAWARAGHLRDRPAIRPGDVGQEPPPGPPAAPA